MSIFPRFIGRERELNVLERLYASGKTTMVPVYGRRRVGKSHLILKFLEEKPGIYFLGKQTSDLLQRRDFLQTAAEALNIPLLASVDSLGWKDVFRIVLEARDSAGIKHPLVIALDEFQWMVESAPELPSILQEALDLKWKKRGDIMLILCGSIIGFMERMVLGKKSPLFGRRSAQILLKPFEYQESLQFHSAWGLEDRTKAYFICGGVPFYHSLFNSQSSFSTQLRDLFLDETAPLYREADFLLREELREVRRYYAILTALGTRRLNGKEIARLTGIDERKLSYYFDRLVDLGYVSKRKPLLHPESRRKTSRVRYEVSDALLSFWFRFIWPNTTYISRMGPRQSMQNLIKPHLPAWFGQRFEMLCQECLPLFYVADELDVPFEIGDFWDSSIQIDVVGIRQAEGIDLGECKWGRVSSAPALRRELNTKREHYIPADSDGLLTIRPWFFTRKPVQHRSVVPEGERWITLADLASLSPPPG